MITVTASGGTIAVVPVPCKYDESKTAWRVIGKYVDGDGATRSVTLNAEGAEYIFKSHAEEIASCMRRALIGGVRISDLVLQEWSVTQVGVEQIKLDYETFENAIWSARELVRQQILEAAHQILRAAKECASPGEIIYQDSRDYVIASKSGREVFRGTHRDGIPATAEVEIRAMMASMNTRREEEGPEP